MKNTLYTYTNKFPAERLRKNKETGSSCIIPELPLYLYDFKTRV